MSKKFKTKRETVRIDGKLREVVTVKDEAGKIFHKIISPLMTEFHPKDFLQIIIGASILAIPVGFTEETWLLGESLPLINVFGFALLSIVFISSFVYYNYYKNNLKEHRYNFLKRVFLTYIISFIVVAILLTLVQKAPWATDWSLAFKRVVIVTFPSSMSAAVVDVVR